MPGRMNVLDADEEWSDASDDVVKSGSATDVSRGEMEDTSSRVAGARLSLSSFSKSSLTKRDPVHSILDKIDAELAAMSTSTTACPQPRASSPTSKSTSSRTRAKSSLPPLLPKPDRMHHAGLGQEMSDLDQQKQQQQQQQHISGSAEIYTDALTDVPTDDDAAAQQAAEEFLSDLDSVVAQQIDNRFKEIMLKKTVNPSAAPLLAKTSSGNTQATPQQDTALTSLPKASAGYATDNDSIMTEDFECRFQSLLVMSDGSTLGADTGTGSKSRHRRGHNSSSNNNPASKKATTTTTAASGKPSTPRKVTSIMKTPTSSEGKEQDRSSAAAAAAGSPALRLNGLNRVLHHGMKSLGEATPDETTPKQSAASSAGVTPTASPNRSRSVSPERSWSDRPKTVSIQDGDGLEAASQEIERESARIQREMERERRARSVSPVRGGAMTSSAGLPPRPARSATPARLQTQPIVSHSLEVDSDPLSVHNLGFHIENADKMILGQELKTLRGALFTTKLQLKEAEKEAKAMRDRAEEARSELMLLEFKRTTATKDFHRLMDDIERKRSMSHSFDTEIDSKRSELRGFEALGITREEAKTLQDENTSLRLRQRGLEALELERDELSRQLEAAKDDLLREQKQGRLHREELREEVETLNCRLEETQNGWSVAQQQVQKLEAAFRRMEREKNELIQEKTHEYNAFKNLARQESKENRQLLSREVDTLNSELQQLQVRVNDLQADNTAKDDQNIKLREEVIALQSQVAQEQAARAAVTDEHRKTLQMLRKETDSAMLQLRESLFLDKQKEVENLRAELEQERRETSSRSDERMAQMLAENAELISEKNQEITRLQDRIRSIQDMQHTAERRMQDKVDKQVREAVSRERAALESENQWKLKNERESQARDTKQRINEMQVTLDQERDTSHRLSREVAHLKEELEEQRRLSREAAKEKLVAVARAKEQVREQTSHEAEQAKEKIKQELQREVDRLQSQLRGAEEDVRALKADRQQLQGRERDSLASLDRAEKTVINEINEECRRSASVLGVSPRQVQFSVAADPSGSRTQITTALANLRAVNEELRNHIQELSSELDSCRAMINTLEKEKEESLENIKLEMEKKRTLELEKLKEKLIREHTEELAKVAQASARQSVANSMVSALRRKETEIEGLKAALDARRDVAAEKYVNLYKTEIAQELEKSQALLLHTSREQKRINDAQQREIDRLEREVKRLAMINNSKTSSHTPTPTSLSPKPQQQQQQYLHSRIKQLQAENNALRRKHQLSKNNMSVPDLSTLSLQVAPRRSASPTRDPKETLRNLEERFRLGEKEALMAEERAKLNSSAMSQKMAEMTKLQNTLSSQNQELHRLEQAYTQLHRQYNQSPVLSAAHFLNTTF